MDIRQLVRDWIVNNGGILDVSGPAAQDLIERLRAHCTERDDTALRAALEEVSELQQDETYSTGDDLRDSIRTMHALRECGEVARKALLAREASKAESKEGGE
jgi:hypothetical protein